MGDNDGRKLTTRWALIALGATMVLGGLILLIWPGRTILVLARVIALVVLIDAVRVLLRIRRVPPSRLQKLFIVHLVTATAIAALTFFWPRPTVLVMALLLGSYLLVAGIAELAWAISSRKENEAWKALALVGAFAASAGLVTLAWPSATLSVIASIIGIAWIVRGALLISANRRTTQLAA